MKTEKLEKPAAAELQTLAAPMAEAPAPTVKPLRLAALKRLGEEEEKLSDTTEASFSDSIVTEGDTGAALEAIAPAPLPESGGFLDTLMAQAGTTGAGTGAVIGSGIPPGVIAGGALLFAAAASGGGGGSSPAPGPSAPAAPPNQPASINASAVQRTGEVREMAGSGEGQEGRSPLTTGGRAALVIDDPDGGNDLKFQAATAEQLQGKYGSFTFNADTGEWTYALDLQDADTIALNEYDGPQYEHLTVTSMDGTASTVIEVKVWGNYAPVVEEDRSITVQANDLALIDLSPLQHDPHSFFSLDSGAYDGYFAIFEMGGFALYFAEGAGEQDNFDYFASSFDVNVAPDGSLYYSWMGNEYADVSITVAAADAAPGDASLYYATGFSADITEGTPGAVKFNITLGNGNAADAGELFTIVLDAANHEQGNEPSFDNALGIFSATGTSAVQVLGSGTSQLALRGTLADLQAFLDGNGVSLTVNNETVVYDSPWGGEFQVTILDRYGNAYEEPQTVEIDFTGVDDAPIIKVHTDGDLYVDTATFYAPQDGDGWTDLDDAAFHFHIYDEEADDFGAWLDLVVTAGAGELGIDPGFFIDGDYDGDIEFFDGADNVIHVEGTREALDSLLDYIQYRHDGSLTSTTLTLALSDETSTDTITLGVIADDTNDAPVLALGSGFPVANYTVTETDGDWTLATATLMEDQHVTIKGVTLTDDAGANDIVRLDFYAYEIGREGDNWYQNGATPSHFYLDPGFEQLGIDTSEGSIALYGTVSDLNAMLAAGALHFAPPPDWEGEFGLSINTSDNGSGGYGEWGYDSMDIHITVAGVNDKPVALQHVQAEGSTEGTVFFDEDWLLDGDFVYDAESYHGDGEYYANEDGVVGEGTELTLQSVTVVSGGGSVAYDAEDGGWVYTPANGAGNESEVQLAYTFSDGAHTATNLIDLTLYNVPI